MTIAHARLVTMEIIVKTLRRVLEFYLPARTSVLVRVFVDPMIIAHVMLDTLVLLAKHKRSQVVSVFLQIMLPFVARMGHVLAQTLATVRTVVLARIVMDGNALELTKPFLLCVLVMERVFHLTLVYAQVNGMVLNVIKKVLHRDWPFSHH
jgi:hypothetical protein